MPIAASDIKKLKRIVDVRSRLLTAARGELYRIRGLITSHQDSVENNRKAASKTMSQATGDQAMWAHGIATQYLEAAKKHAEEAERLTQQEEPAARSAVDKARIDLEATEKLLDRRRQEFESEQTKQQQKDADERVLAVGTSSQQQ